MLKNLARIAKAPVRIVDATVLKPIADVADDVADTIERELR